MKIRSIVLEVGGTLVDETHIFERWAATVLDGLAVLPGWIADQAG